MSFTHKIQKRVRRNKTGNRIQAKNYSLRYRYDGMVADKWISLHTSNKEAAEEKARQFKIDYEHEQAGLIPVKEQRDGAKKLLGVHMEDFLSDMESRGKTGRRNKTTKQYRSRIMRLLHECGWEYLKDVTPDSFMKWRSAFNGAAKTKNHYLADCCTFLNWMVQYQRAPRNPLCSVRKVEVAGKLQRVRRAFTNDELERLFAVAPAYRKIVYFVAARTGLRYRELQELRWGDVHMQGESGYFLARASTTKNKKEEPIPMNASLVLVLKEYRPDDFDYGDKVFHKGVPRCETLQIDLKAAGVDYVDSLGRYADFHSFRHTYATWLQINKVGRRTAQSLMRHSDPKLTDKTYTDDTLLPLQTEVERIDENPDLIRQLIRQTGKNGQNLVNHDETCKSSVACANPLNDKDGAGLAKVEEGWENGGGGGSRTRNAVDARQVIVSNEVAWIEPLIRQLIRHSEADRADVLRVIKSWPLLSVQLRKAVLAIVGTQSAYNPAGDP